MGQVRATQTAIEENTDIEGGTLGRKAGVEAALGKGIDAHETKDLG
jgi:hypothetical protein